jgi:DNA-binding MarR family transcriptional regulator
MTKGYNIEKSIGFLIYRTALAMKGAFERVLKEQGLDITPEQCGILALLLEEEGLSQKEIGDVLFKDKPNISRMLDILERKRLIFRQATDRRRYSVFLTEEGKQLIEKVHPLKLQLTEKAFRGLLAREMETLENIINRIYRNIT